MHSLSYLISNSIMKKNEIKGALDQLKRIKMPKIEDKALRNDLIKDHYAIFDAGKKHDDAVEREREVILGAFKEDQQALDDIQRQLQGAVPGSDEQRELVRKANSYDAYYKAVRVFNEKLEKIGNEEVKGLKPINREKFMEEIEKQDFDLAMVEGLYPLFELEEVKK